MTERLEQRTWFRLLFGDISWYQESKEPGKPQELQKSPARPVEDVNKLTKGLQELTQLIWWDDGETWK